MKDAPDISKDKPNKTISHWKLCNQRLVVLFIKGLFYYCNTSATIRVYE